MGGVKDPFLQKGNRETKLRDAKLHKEGAEKSVAAGLMEMWSFWFKTSSLCRERPQHWASICCASATAVSLHSDWPNMNFLPLSLLELEFQCLYVTTKRCTRFSCSKGNREEWAWLKTFAQHCRLGVWANMLTEQAVPQKSPIFKWILELKLQSTMSMYRCGAETKRCDSEASRWFPAVALFHRTCRARGFMCVCLCRRRAMEARIHFIWWKKKGRTTSDGFFLFSHTSSDPSNQPFVCVC